MAKQGEGVSVPAVGARVMGFGASAFADYMVVDARHVLRVSDGMDWETAASYPTALVTMHNAIVSERRLFTYYCWETSTSMDSSTILNVRSSTDHGITCIATDSGVVPD